jgi:hypothetical protein
VALYHQKLPAYERELIGLVKAVLHWRPYIWGRPFTVCMGHYSLKFLLDQQLSTIPQHTWVSKLFGYDLTVVYRQGKLNGAADALSRQEEDPAAVHAISSPTFELFDKLRDEIQHSPEAVAVCSQVAEGKAEEGWSLVDGLVLFRGKIFIPEESTLWPELLTHAHAVMKGFRKPSKGGGHPSIALRSFDGFASLCGDARSAKSTSPNTFIQHACCNPFRFHPKFGVTFRWTLLRDF